MNWNKEINKNRRRFINNDYLFSGNGIEGSMTPQRIQMIADTEYSCEDEEDKSNRYRNYVYYPGFDIFDNHIMRNRSFKVVNNTGSGRSNGVFNTLADTVRDASGLTRKIFTRPNGLSSKPVQVDKHLYTYDELMTFEDSVNSNLYEENGWFGFINHSNLITERQDKITKVLNNRKACEFVDMYPGRELFSFSPAYNERFDRLENNWDISLTYPYECDYSHYILYEKSPHTYNKAINGLKALSVSATYGLSGEPIMVFRTYVKHNLKRGDSVNMWYKNSDGTDYEYTTVRVKDVGNLSDGDKRYFFYTDDAELLSNMTMGVKNSEPDFLLNKLISMILRGQGGKILDIRTVTQFVMTILNYFHDRTRISILEFCEDFGKTMTDAELRTFLAIWFDEIYNFRIQKVVNGVPSKYYVRKFRKLPNFKNRKRDVTETDLQSRDNFLNYVVENAKYEFDNERYKLGFATTAYTDDCTQITYTDTIDVANLTDNLGRPLSEFYVTIMKRNRGNRLWYESPDNSNDIWGEGVEQSHCFGKVTSGFELSNEKDDYKDLFALRSKHHDVLLLNNDKNSGNTFINQSVPLEGNTDDGLSLDSMEEFCGDIVEFSPSEFTEHKLSDVCYRFNTYQRENPPKSNGRNMPFIYHNIKYDDYDWSGNNDSAFTLEQVSVQTEARNEGYYHQAHYPIKIRDFDVISQDSHTDIAVSSVTPAQCGKMYVKVKTRLRHNLNRGDNVLVFDDKNGLSFKFNCSYIESPTSFLMIPAMPQVNEYNTENEWEYFMNITSVKYETPLNWLTLTEYLKSGELCIRKPNPAIPSYAARVGSNTYLWRNIVSIEDNESIEYVYTNNAFYISPVINFYLKRQDPHDTNHLYAKDLFPNDISGKQQKKSIYEYEENIEPVC